MTEWAQLAVQGGFAVLLAGVLWLGFKVLEKYSQREQDRADRAQEYLQRIVDQRSAEQAQTLAAMQALTKEAISTGVQVAVAMQAVEQELTAHRAEASAAAAVGAQERQRMVQALDQLCTKIGSE